MYWRSSYVAGKTVDLPHPGFERQSDSDIAVNQVGRCGVGRPLLPVRDVEVSADRTVLGANVGLGYTHCCTAFKYITIPDALAVLRYLALCIYIYTYVR